MPYIVHGYVFLSAYNWISFNDNKDLNNTLIKSIAASFVLKSTYELVINKYNIQFSSELLQTLICVFVSFVLGFSFGKIISHRSFNAILNKLHIGRTTNQNIWDDVIKPYTWVRVFMKDGSSYLGQYKYGEPYNNEPIIVLATYQKLDKDTDIVIDNSKNSNELIMLNTKNFDRIEITYTKNSEEKNVLKNFTHLLNRIKRRKK